MLTVDLSSREIGQESGKKLIRAGPTSGTCGDRAKLESLKVFNPKKREVFSATWSVFGFKARVAEWQTQQI